MRAERPLDDPTGDLPLGEPVVGRPSGQGSVREVPQSLPALPAGYPDFSSCRKELEHLPDIPARCPAARSPRGVRDVLERPGWQWPVAPQPCKDVAAQGITRRESSHEPTVDGKLLDRHDKRPVLQEAPLTPQEALQVLGIVRAQPAPQHEQVATRDNVGRIELETAEAACDGHDPFGVGRWTGPGEELRPDRQRPCLSR